MRIFLDKISGDELISDSFPMEEAFEGFVYKVQTHLQSRTGVKIDIGANPSAENPDEEAADEASVVVNDVIDSFRLQETGFDKKSYVTYIKGYLKKLKEVNAYGSEDEKMFERKAADFVKNVVAEFGEYQFYTGESMDPEGMVVLMKYEGDANAPCAFFFKEGLRYEKV